MAADLLFFDAFTRIGPRPKKHPSHPWKLSDVLAEMDHCSISGALAASTLSVQYEMMHSNLELSAWIAPHKHLFTIWNVMPHQTGEFPEPQQLESLMRRHDVRAVTIYPKANAWDWEADHSQVVLRWLEKRRILTILNRQEFGQYSELDRFLSRHRQLPLLLTAAGWSEQRFVLPLLRKHPNLHISFDHFQIHRGVEHLCKEGLENQLVFASNAPLMSMGAHRCYVDYAEVPAGVRQKIASGNLIRLLRGQGPPRLRTNKDEDVLMTAARHGQPLPVPVIDMHMHILHEGMDGAGGAYRMQRGGPPGVFHLLKRIGCTGGGFMSWNGTVSADARGGNECVAQALDAAPKGFWGLASFDPTHYTQEELGRMIPEVYRDQRFIGMKPYVQYGVEYHHRSYDIWWRYGNRRGFYAAIHRNRGDFLEVNTLAKKYPRVRWVVYHCGSDYATADQAIESMRRHPNVHAEITLTPVTFGIIDYLVKHAGEDRILYGSDLPMRDPRQQLGWVVFSRLSLVQKKKALGANALRVIQPCLRQLPARHRPF
ncbi:MAG: amidohydrolase family protein [Verrucomicrobia bacterium]|nr:amidohydrolase family protein [Verrucomicrobiota bacterium]